MVPYASFLPEFASFTQRPRDIAFFSDLLLRVFPWLLICDFPHLLLLVLPARFWPNLSFKMMHLGLLLLDLLLFLAQLVLIQRQFEVLSGLDAHPFPDYNFAMLVCLLLVLDGVTPQPFVPPKPALAQAY
jgi:hypothetical protein